MSKYIQILADSSRGVYIPQHFAETCNHWDINPCYLRDLRDGPDSPFYWEVWQETLDKAVYVDHEGVEWTLYQDGDLFAVAVDMLTDAEQEEFFGL